MHDEFKNIVSGNMCKGLRSEWLARDHHLHMGNLTPTDYLEQCYTLAGIDAKFPRPIQPTDTSDTYATALRESDDWIEIVPEFGSDFYPLLEDYDLLTWALSPDGTEGCNGLPGLNGGNTTTGFLIEAENDYPIVWVSPDLNIPSGIYPLAECLELETTKGTGFKSRLIYIHRRVG